MRKRAGWLLMGAVLLGSLTLTGVVSGEEQTTEEAEDGILKPEEEEVLEKSEEAAEQENNETEEDAAPKKVGISIPDSNKDNWADQARYLSQKLEELGYLTDIRFAWGDSGTQEKDIEKWIESDVELMVINPVDAGSLAEVLEEAGEKEIPVLSLEHLIQNTENVKYLVTFDYLGIGQSIGAYIEEQAKLKDASKEAPKTIELFMGPEQEDSAFLFYTGLMEKLKPYLEEGSLVCLSGQTSFQEVSQKQEAQETDAERMNRILDTYYEKQAPDIICTASDQLAELALSNIQKRDYYHEEEKALKQSSGKIVSKDGEEEPEETEEPESEEWPLITGQGASLSGMNNIVDQKMAVTTFENQEDLASVCAETVKAILDGEKVENKVEQYDNGVMVVPARLSEISLVNLDNYEELLIDTGVYAVRQQIKIPDGNSLS